MQHIARLFHLGGGLIVDNFSRIDTVPQISRT